MGDGYLIHCRACSKDTWAMNIVDLIDNRSSQGGLQCGSCSASDAFIYRKSKTQDGSDWERWIKGVIRVDTGEPTYSPYLLLTAATEGGPIDGAHFNYYRDTRPAGGKLKHGHGPGGAPVFSKSELLSLVKQLVAAGFLSVNDLSQLLGELELKNQ